MSLAHLKMKLVTHIERGKYTRRILRFYFNFVLPIFHDVKGFIYYYLLNKNIGDEKILPVLTFEPTNICNAKCVFCAYRKTDDKKMNMTFDMFKKTLDEFKTMGGESIRLTPVVGEAFVDKNLFEKIIYAKEQGFKVQLYSNGTLLNFSENYKKIVDAKIDRIAISISDVEESIEAKDFGIDLTLAKHKLEGIKKMISYNLEQEKQITIDVSFRPSRPPHEIVNSEKYKFFKHDHIETHFLLGFDNRGGSISKEELNGIMQLKRPIKFRKYPCKRLYNAVTILSNGNVRLCACRLKKTTDDDLVVGNMNEGKLKDILMSNKVKEIRKGFGKGKYPEVCKGCSFYEPYYVKYDK